MTDLGEEDVATGASSRDPFSFRLDVAMLALAISVAVGSLGTWASLPESSVMTFQYSSVPYAGTSQVVGRVGWATLTFAVLSVAALTLGVTRRANVARSGAYLVVTSLLGATVVIAVVALINLHLVVAELGLPATSNPALQEHVGWGLWLCLSSSALALGIGTTECVRLLRTVGRGEPA